MKKPTLFGKYFLLERINVGGMAEVFRAKAFGVEGFERLVAVKRILPNIAEDAEFIRMFIEEAKLSVQLTHANIAQIFDLGVVEGAYYIALEHVHGRDLRGIFDRCRQLGETMPIAQACFLAMKVCEGLDYAHNKRDQGRPLQLVHRDVSPQNILVSFEGEVKLIDFGVAKAASNGTPTQAGILKGKFGYMSPEQVRGLPVDRRSDVFSCGIVLYELLTGERLFVGESDFSTLEKVRNVEILPPSTYNRKIPDELERIVLKALSKDVEDRYQNAIDLHDELQAFVYTAGEFYSRKDLAGWMKKTFAKEIEEELDKLESFRELKPPVPGAPDSPVITQRSSIQKSSGTRKPPTQPAPVVKPPPPPTLPRSAVPIAPVAISASAPVPSPTATPPAATPVVGAAPGSSRIARAPHRPGPSSWDDDDLETRLFDQQEDARHKSQRANLPLQAPPVSSSPGIALPSGDTDVSEPVEPPEHLLPQTGEVPSWNGADLAASPTMGQATLKGAVGMLNANASGPHAAPSGPYVAPAPSGPHVAPSHSGPHVSGSHAIPAATDGMGIEIVPGRRRGESASPPSRELSAPARLVAVPQEIASEPSSEPIHHPVTQFGLRVADRRIADRRRSILVLVIGCAVIATISIIFAILLHDGAKKPAGPEAVKPDKPAVPDKVAAPVVPADPSTGFDLYVSPAGVTQWRLDGELRTDRLPSRIRGIAPGPHTVQIDPPPGFMSQNQQIGVEQGKAPKVEISLQPINGITGTFESTPPGALVSLIIDGKRQPLGPAPAKAPLDPRSTYQVLFEKAGYVSINRPITFSGALEERVTVVLEKDEADNKVAPPPTPEKAPDKTPDKAPEKVPDKTPSRPVTAPSQATSAPKRPTTKPSEPDGDGDKGDDTKAQGVLVLGSKPPCEIAIDGSATGLHTPQKDIKLSVGRHRVTLTNAEFNIKETFTVDIKADAPEKLIKDYSDRLPE